MASAPSALSLGPRAEPGLRAEERWGRQGEAGGGEASAAAAAGRAEEFGPSEGRSRGKTEEGCEPCTGG